MRLRSLRKTQRWLAYGAPAVVAASSLWHGAAAGFARNVVLSNVALLVFVATLAVSLFKRSPGLETAWGSTRIPASANESLDDPVDFLSLDVAFILGALFFVLISVFQGWR